MATGTTYLLKVYDAEYGDLDGAYSYPTVEAALTGTCDHILKEDMVIQPEDVLIENGELLSLRIGAMNDPNERTLIVLEREDQQEQNSRVDLDPASVRRAISEGAIGLANLLDVQFMLEKTS